MNDLRCAIATNPLFDEIDPRDARAMLACIDAKTKAYKKDEILMMTGDPIGRIGLVVSGRVQVIREDVNGNSVILTELAASEIFGEAFACAGVQTSPVTVEASEDSEILWLDFRKVIRTCQKACSFHARLIENMLKLIAGKNLMLNQKLEIISKRSTREKLLAYFDAKRGAAKQFSIPFNREELARYLCVDRSAMSHELSKMQEDGLIRFYKNSFTIL